MPSTLSSLAVLINRSIITLEKACSESKLPFPSFDEPFTPASEAFRANPEAEEAAKVIAAAAHQLMMMVLPPSVALYTAVSGEYKSAALRVCLEANVTEILREGGKEGMHVKEIAERTKVNHKKLARCLRYLATHHVYKEVSPDVFTNNRVSSMMDTGKAVDDLIARPEEKHENTPGLAAIASHHLDEVYKAAGYLWESMSDPATAHSFESNETPFNLGLNVKTSFWETIALPEPIWQFRQRRFHIGMKGIAGLESADAILKAFDWRSLPKESVVVDVGGGIGGSSLVLAKNLPDIKIVVQDKPTVLAEGATALWEREMPEALASGRVTLQAHDFFTPQPIKNASVFFLKQVIHDWPDPYATKILSELRKAARPDTRLIIVDSAIPFACHDPSGDKGKGVIGAVPKEAPEPLLANYGVANELTYAADVTMLIVTNAQERTVKHLGELLQSTGWRMTKIVRDHETGSFMQPVEAVPMVKIPVGDTAE
ncbi:4-O-methyltransferase 1 [Psilocybe cubensis]|uniref:S-adenosyl-L-methionine-dependent methyltransferase n=2 Tax=Psilocybe cubensis TaxID=181762 RepID=A0A8H8CNY4_PSICU|nr:4-O-methyltransferase 1 [Psilocybe cubensis]KAH9484887.1 4-O-methyltransferase 1 [Psilocybe cubensis]